MYDIVLSASDSEHCASETCSKKGMSSACNHKHVVIQEESHIAMNIHISLRKLLTSYFPGGEESPSCRRSSATDLNKIKHLIQW